MRSFCCIRSILSKCTRCHFYCRPPGLGHHLSLGNTVVAVSMSLSHAGRAFVPPHVLSVAGRLPGGPPVPLLPSSSAVPFSVTPSPASVLPASTLTPFFALIDSVCQSPPLEHRFHESRGHVCLIPRQSPRHENIVRLEWHPVHGSWKNGK